MFSETLLQTRATWYKVPEGIYNSYICLEINGCTFAGWFAVPFKRTLTTSQDTQYDNMFNSLTSKNKPCNISQELFTQYQKCENWEDALSCLYRLLSLVHHLRWCMVNFFLLSIDLHTSESRMSKAACITWLLLPVELQCAHHIWTTNKHQITWINYLYTHCLVRRQFRNTSSSKWLWYEYWISTFHNQIDD
jgi:hypothetical protein